MEAEGIAWAHVPRCTSMSGSCAQSASQLAVAAQWLRNMDTCVTFCLLNRMQQRQVHCWTTPAPVAIAANTATRQHLCITASCHGRQPVHPRCVVLVTPCAMANCPQPKPPCATPFGHNPTAGLHVAAYTIASIFLISSYKTSTMAPPVPRMTLEPAPCTGQHCTPLSKHRRTRSACGVQTALAA